jgi:hypothetical protein
VEIASGTQVWRIKRWNRAGHHGSRALLVEGAVVGGTGTVAQACVDRRVALQRLRTFKRLLLDAPVSAAGASGQPP